MMALQRGEENPMSLAEMMPELQALPRADKLRAIQFLAAELAREENVDFFPPGKSYPIWSPFDSFDAARTLMQLLEQERASS
jgi:hypothetical protein